NCDTLNRNQWDTLTRIYIQCLEEQKKIANFLTNIESKSEQIEKELAMLKEFKKGLLQGMFV
ncbi:MAG TPA: hypothetical protein PLK90_08740, partial [Clostridiales bacterium]|nr:hypothetical protein [Clostridiales bacterium]HQP70470.1 hypothetical protein [Clostridiales bacterium]